MEATQMDSDILPQAKEKKKKKTHAEKNWTYKQVLSIC